MFGLNLFFKAKKSGKEKPDATAGAEMRGDDSDTETLADENGIDPQDGKTRSCNRTMTFDEFLAEEQLGEDKVVVDKGEGKVKGAKRMGVFGAIAKAFRKEKKGGKKNENERCFGFNAFWL